MAAAVLENDRLCKVRLHEFGYGGGGDGGGGGCGGGSIGSSNFSRGGGDCM